MKTVKHFSLIAAMLLFAACGGDDANETGSGNNGGGDENREIVVPNESQLTQTVYADQTQGASGVSFTTKGAWSSLIAETRGDAPDWLSVSPDSGDKAGSYTISITLGENLTGADRKATITIVCGSDRITITVEQKAEEQSGEDPVPEQRVVSKVTMMDEDGNTGVVEFRYDDQKRVSGIKTYEREKLTYEMSLTYAEHKITSLQRSYEEYPATDFVQTFTLGNGRVTAMREENSNYDRTEYEYDANGYLTRMSEFSRLSSVDHDGNVTEGDVVMSDVSDYTWSDGNLSKIVSSYSGETNTPVTYAYEYTALPNDKANIDLSTLAMDADIMQIFGFTGNRTKNIIQKEIVTGDKWGKDNGTTTYRYVTDANGYVTDIYSKHRLEGGKEEAEIHMAKIEYK